MVVRMRRNTSQTAKRRSHHALSSARLTKEKGESRPRLRHRASKETGLYRGKVAIDVVARAKREARRMKRKEKELRASGIDTTKKETTAETATT